MVDATLVRTRQALHAVAECVLAGPQYRAHGTIRLRVVPDGIATVRGPALRLTATHLVAEAERVPLAAATVRQLAAVAGVEPGPPDGLYADGSSLTEDDPLEVDEAAARLLLAAYSDGEEALRRVPGAGEPVVWPEHFDVAIRVDATNYGVSPGDGFLAVPYAYVGPDGPRTGDFWNAPFGAARAVTELGDAAGIEAFFAEGRRRLAAAG